MRCPLGLIAFLHQVLAASSFALNLPQNSQSISLDNVTLHASLSQNDNVQCVKLDIATLPGLRPTICDSLVEPACQKLNRI